ncbi:unnamed protein product [Mytilus coruscus]|uniref:Uncharacterized protein n=1 Tax=Mytilus coruscus TaxID=42192 RepID=A0A6J8B3G4_MYTCO|nr:unnamed protein product [Mytilus coruscus]
MTTPKDGKQIANMLYHAGVETLLTVGYAEIGKKVLRRPAPKVDFNMNDVVMLSIDILLAMATKDMLIKQEKAQAEWSKERTQRLDFINEQLQKEHHAEHTFFEDVDQAMKQYYYITSKQLTPLSPKPKLSDFYTPSEDQKNREIAFVVGDYFNLFRNMKDNKLIQEIEDALNFKGFPKQIEQSEEVENDEEWPKEVVEYDLEKLKDLEYLRDHTIILDDQGSQKLDKQVANIISKGRHFKIQLVFLAHLSTDLNPKSRNNVKEIYITTGNSIKFFHDLKEKFMIKDLSSFSRIEYGIIRYNLNRDSFVVYDKNYKKIHDSSANKISTRSDFNIGNFLNQQNFEDLEKSEIVNFLESQSPINVTEPLLLFYLNYYLIQNNYKPNMSKLKNILGDYYEENKTFKSKNIVPLIKVFKEGYKEITK